MKRILTIFAFAAAGLLITSCGRVGPDSPPDKTPPVIASTSPQYGAQGVPINAGLTVGFNEEMDPKSINKQTIVLTRDGSAVDGSVTYSAKTASFKSSSNLAANSVYTLVITIGVKDLAGNALVAPYFCTFTTGAAPDTAPPTVVGATPVDAPGGVSISSPVTATFSEAMNASTITTSTFAVSGLAGTVSYDDATKTATFVPAGSLGYDTTYTATIISGINGVKDLAGNALVNNYTWSFKTGPAPDGAPDGFGFTSQTNVPLSTRVVSNSITVTGINVPSEISITGGEYAINGGPYTSAPATVTNGQTVTVQQTSSPNFGTTTIAELTIGGVKGGFSVTTLGADTTPDQFNFTPLNDVATSTVFISNQITVNGINAPAVISITGGSYSVDGSSYRSDAGTVMNGQIVTVQQTSSPNFGTMTEAVLTIGTVRDAFRVTTLGEDTTPDQFSFTALNDVATNTPFISNPITVNGINAPAVISITGGTYSLDGGFTYTSDAGTAMNGQVVTVQQTSSPNFSTTTEAVLTIGTVSGAFSVTTQAEPPPVAISITNP